MENTEAKGQVIEKLITQKQVFKTEEQEAYIDTMVSKIPPQAAAEYEGLDKYEKALKFWEAYHGAANNTGKELDPTAGQSGAGTSLTAKKKKGGKKTPAREYEPGQDISTEAQSVFQQFVGEAAIDAQYEKAKGTKIVKVLFPKPTGDELAKMGLMPAVAKPTFKASKAKEWEDSLAPGADNRAKFDKWKAAAEKGDEVPVKYSQSTGGACGVKVQTIEVGEKKKDTVNLTLDKPGLQDFLSIDVPMVIEQGQNGLSAKLDITFVEVENDVASTTTTKPVIRVKIGGAADARKDEKALHYEVVRETVKATDKDDVDRVSGTLTLADEYSFDIQVPEEEGSTKLVTKTIYPKGRALVPRLAVKAEFREIFKEAAGSEVKLPTSEKEKSELAKKQMNLIQGIYTGELSRTKVLSSKLANVIKQANDAVTNAQASEGGDIE